MSVIVKFAEDRLVEVDVEEISAEEAEASGAPVVDKSEPEPEPEPTEESGRSLFRLLALFALVVGAALAAGKLRGGGPDIGEEIEIETDVGDPDESELEN